MSISRTVASGTTAPLGSLTEPPMLAVSAWARTVEGDPGTSNATNAVAARQVRARPMPILDLAIDAQSEKPSP
jgi:hypothetical protein